MSPFCSEDTFQNQPPVNLVIQSNYVKYHNRGSCKLQGDYVCHDQTMVGNRRSIQKIMHDDPTRIRQEPMTMIILQEISVTLLPIHIRTVANLRF